MESGPSTVSMSVNEFSKLVQNRRDLYEALLRSGCYLPKFKTTMITEECMRNVIAGKAFCPKYKDIKMLPCPRPPSKDVLLKKFLQILVTQNFRHTGVDEKHQADKRWLMEFVSTFKPDGDIFKKDYLPPAKATKLSTIKSIEVPKEFIEGLP